jgi:sodium transport system permease protein
LLDPTNTTALIYLIPVLVTSIIYSLLALWWAIELFRNENVLFRESERLDVRLWIHHLFRDKESTPSFTEAGFCFVLIMLLQFAAIKFLGQATRQASIEELPSLSLKLLIVQQLAVIGTPALLMAVMLTTSARKSLLIRMPKPSMLGVAACLAIILHPLSLELSVIVGEFFRFPALPPSVHKVLSLMTDGSQPLWLILLAFAIAPAICEELAFRGFILSGFRRSKYVGIAIVLSALAFGIMHMIPQQVFNATLLGLVLGLIAVRSNSLLPGIAFHLIYNCLAVAHMRVSRIWVEGLPTWMDNTPFEWCLRMEDGHVRYQWPLLLVTAVVAIWLLRWILNFERSKDLPKATAVVAPHMLDKPSPV